MQVRLIRFLIESKKILSILALIPQIPTDLDENPSMLLDNHKTRFAHPATVTFAYFLPISKCRISFIHHKYFRELKNTIIIVQEYPLRAANYPH